MKLPTARLRVLAYSLLTLTPSLALAQNANEERVYELDEVVMEAPVAPSAQLFLPEVQGAKILGAKKTTNVALEEMPEIVQNNLREAFITTPGLNVAEEAIPARVNISYRGIGDPHESVSVLTMKDGVPLESDWFGYPTIYYIPPIESVERIEFIRGGGALLYGPQAGPVVNYITASPRMDTAFGGSAQGLGGSYGYYSTYLEASGTSGNFGYGADFLASGANGFRENGDYAIETGSANALYHIDENQRIRLDFDAYYSDIGEAGRLTTAQWNVDPSMTTRPRDRVWIQRYFPVLNYVYETDDFVADIKTWGGYQSRVSRRSTAGGVAAFLPGTLMNVDDREFTFYGLDARARKDYQTDFTDGTNSLTAGITFYYGDAPNNRQRSLGTDTTGIPIYDESRYTVYGAAFAENVFRFGRWAVIPAFRLDIPTVSVKENYNFGVTRPLYDETLTSVAPLGSLGVTYDIDINNQAYASFATSYTPKQYVDVGNPSSNRIRSTNADVAYNYQGELGARGSYSTWFSYDGSLFYDYYTGIVENLNIGAGNTVVNNAGDAIYYGLEAAVEVDLFAFIDAQEGTTLGDSAGRFSIFGNVQLLDAEFVSGQFDGNTPSYSPDYLVKTGVVWDWEERVKAAFTGQFVDEQYWNDANNNTGGAAMGPPWNNPRKIPAYMVWDFTVEFTPITSAGPFKDLTILGGVTNVFDAKYYSRVRGGVGGIDTLPGRTFYAGARVEF